MEHIDKIIEMADAEFGAIAKNGKFKSREEIDSVYKLMDIVKDGYCVMDMEDGMGGNSYDDGMSYERGGSYNDGRSIRYDGGSSYARGRRNARRDSMGRYSRESYRGNSYRTYSGDGGYSRDGEDEYKDQLRNLMDQTSDEQTRRGIKRMLDQMG